jgi:hypothetical protein
MPLPKGSRAPQKVSSPLLRELAPRLKEATTEELLILRGLLNGEISDQDARENGSALYQDSARNRCVVALDRSDLNCRIAKGFGIRTMQDYHDHREEGDPHATWIVRVLGGGSWPTALSEAGIGNERYLEPILVRGSGSRKRPGGCEAWTLAERVEALAYAIERNHGYDVTKEAWHHYRDLVAFETPDYATLVESRKQPDGKMKSRYPLSKMHELARKLILREPERLPRSTRRIQLVDDVRTAEAKRPGKKRAA